MVLTGKGFFGIVFYWVNWVFIAAWLVGFVVAWCVRRDSNIEVYSDDENEETENFIN